MTKYIYAFDEGQKDMKDLLGGKGANLSEMKRLGLPVPDGFTITTEACIEYLKQGETLPETVITQLKEQLEAFQHVRVKRSQMIKIYFLYLYVVVRRFPCQV